MSLTAVDSQMPLLQLYQQSQQKLAVSENTNRELRKLLAEKEEEYNLKCNSIAIQAHKSETEILEYKRLKRMYTEIIDDYQQMKCDHKILIENEKKLKEEISYLTINLNEMKIEMKDNELMHENTIKELQKENKQSMICELQKQKMMFEDTISKMNEEMKKLESDIESKNNETSIALAHAPPSNILQLNLILSNSHLSINELRARLSELILAHEHQFNQYQIIEERNKQLQR